MNSFNIGVPRERKFKEGRVGMSPAGVKEVLTSGAYVRVQIEKGAGLLAGFADEDYVAAGASITEDTNTLYQTADLIVKVKEPTPEEYGFLAHLRHKTLFTYLHLAGVDSELTRTLLRNEVTAIAYENVETQVDGRRIFPLLVPMSKIAGTQSMRNSLKMFAAITKTKARVVIIGGGVVGEAALIEALEKKVTSITLFELNPLRRQYLHEQYARVKSGRKVIILPMDEMLPANGASAVFKADIVISGVMNPGGSEAPKVLTKSEFALMKKGCLVVDVAIDQGGSTEWSRPTHQGETYEEGGLIFSCTANIPGSVPHESTLALTSATLPYIKLFAQYAGQYQHSREWWLLKDHLDLRCGLQTWRGSLTNRPVSSKHAIFREYQPLDTFF